MAQVKFTAEAGRHERKWTPVVVRVPLKQVPRWERLLKPKAGSPPLRQAQGKPCPFLASLMKGQPVSSFEGDYHLIELDEQGKEGRRLPCQVAAMGEEAAIHFIVDEMPANARRQYALEDSRVEALGVELKEEEHKVKVLIGGELFTSYCFAPTQVRPWLYPVIGPFGDPVTREIEGDPKKGFDHIHHRSIYSAWGDLNGVDCWSEEKNHGFVKHHCFLPHLSGSVGAQITAHDLWTDAAGKTILESVTVLRFYALPRQARLVDYNITFFATQGDVRFGDTKEGGILSVRVFKTMTVRTGGKMENVFGGINEAECWGKRAHWIDYSGLVKGKEVGIALFDHPQSFRHPTYWHARDYGLVTANPFGLSAFLGAGHDGSHVLKKGESLTFRYRLYIHTGDATSGQVKERYLDFVAPPRVELLKD